MSGLVVPPNLIRLMIIFDVTMVNILILGQFKVENVRNIETFLFPVLVFVKKSAVYARIRGTDYARMKI